MNSRSIVLFFLVITCVGWVQSQEPSKQEVKQQAESQLQTMTPQEIDAKIKDAGMTRSEAETKAKEYGIDLNTYLNRTSGLKPQQPVLTTEQKPGQTATQDKKADAAVTAEEQKKVEEEIDNQKKGLTPPDAEAAKIYGLSIFRSGTATFEPTPSLADKEYIVGSGDVLKISLWGQLQSTEEVTVSKEGRITLSTIGTVLVSGYTIEEAKKRIIIALSRSYSGLVSQPPTIFLDLSLSKLRPIRVFIMGEVQNPGGYLVSNFANVFNSLFVVGGPKASGSMREVRVIRNDKVIAKVDLYDYLFGAVKTADVRVNDNDIIYVPLRGKRVAIQGEVLRPSSYELLPGENLKKLIEFSGGLHSNVYKERIQVDRVIPLAERVKGGEERRLYDIEFSEIATSKKDYILEDDDVVTIFPIVDVTMNYVVIQGAVKRPGTFQIDKVKTVKDLINAADGLLPTVYLQRAELLRQYPSGKLEVVTLDLNKVLTNDPKHNIILERFDKINIFSIYDINGPRSITISGHVKLQGTYPYADSMTIGGLLRSLGGLEDSLYRSQTFLERGTLTRLNSDLRTRRSIYFNPGEIINQKIGDFKLLPDDEIRIFSRSEMREGQDPIEVSGAAKRPGIYPWTTNLTLYDLVFDAVGLTDTLYIKNILLETADLIRRNNDGYTTRIVPFNLGKLFYDHVADTLLLPGDRIIIYPRNAIEERERAVDIFGSVKKPGRYQLSENMTLVDLLLQAGGYTEEAYDVQAEIARVTRTGLGKDSLVHTIFAKLPDLFDVNAITPQQLETMRLKSFALLHRDQIFIRPNPAYVFQQYVTVEGEVQFPGSYALNVINERISHVIERAGGVKPNGYLRGGRLTRDSVTIRTNIENAVDDDEGPEDIILKPGDVISIPKKPGSVIISGNVSNPGIYGYADNKSFSYYIDIAGDKLDSTDFAVVTYPEGLSRRVNFGWFRDNPGIPDGSSIVVFRIKPPLPELPGEKGESFFSSWKDVMAVFASTLTVLVLATKL